MLLFPLKINFFYVQFFMDEKKIYNNSSSAGSSSFTGIYDIFFDDDIRFVNKIIIHVVQLPNNIEIPNTIKAKIHVGVSDDDDDDPNDGISLVE